MNRGNLPQSIHHSHTHFIRKVVFALENGSVDFVPVIIVKWHCPCKITLESNLVTPAGNKITNLTTECMWRPPLPRHQPERTAQSRWVKHRLDDSREKTNFTLKLYGCLSSTSGAIYSGVPHVVVISSFSPVCWWAKPKSLMSTFES